MTEVVFCQAPPRLFELVLVSCYANEFDVSEKVLSIHSVQYFFFFLPNVFYLATKLCYQQQYKMFCKNDLSSIFSISQKKSCYACVFGIACVLPAVTVIEPTNVLTRKTQSNTENACGNRMCKRSFQDVWYARNFSLYNLKITLKKRSSSISKHLSCKFGEEEDYVKFQLSTMER